ncbi:MAG: hypothetical protein WD691_10980 [Acidimicrobiales bacterium]
MKLRTAVVALPLLLAACGGDDDAPPTTTMAAETTTTETTPASAPQAALTGFTECTDPPGDGAGADLISATLGVQGQVLTISYQTAAPLPGPSFSYYINIFSAGYQIGLRSIDGEVFRLVADLTEGGQENLTTSYTLDGNLATLVVPLSALPRLAQPFDYSAVITVDGVDVDKCDGTFRAAE